MISIARQIAAVLMLAVVSIAAQDPASQAQRAERAMADGRFSEAVALYGQLSNAFPDNLELKRNLALALHSAKRYSEALRCFREILQHLPADQASLLFSGLELTTMHRPAEAVPVLTGFLSQNADNSPALVARGGAYLALSRYDAAVADFSKAAEVDAHNVHTWEGLGKAYLLGAQQAFQRIEEKNAFSAEWFALLARSSLSSKNYKQAFGLFREAEARSPDLPGIHSGIAEVYRATNHDDWASLEESKEKHAVPGATTEVRRDYLQALTYQQRSADVLERLARDPETPEYHALLGLADRMQGRDIDSADEFRRALSLSPANSTLKLELATSLWLAKDCNSALPFLRNLSQAGSSSPESRHVLGECLVEEGQPQDAIPLLRAALKDDPGLLPAESALGRALLHAGLYRDAVIHLKKAVALNDPAVLVQLATAYRHLGDDKEASEALKQYRDRSAQRIQDGQNGFSRDITPP